MTSKNIYMALGGIDPSLILAAAPLEPGEKPQSKKRSSKSGFIGLIAACLCIVLVIGIALPYLKDFISPFNPSYSEPYITAEEVGKIFHPLEYTAGIGAYEELYVNEVDMSALGTIPKDKHIDIYKLNKSDSAVSKSELEEFESKMMDKLATALGADLNNSSRSETSYSPQKIGSEYYLGNYRVQFIQSSANEFDDQPKNYVTITREDSLFHGSIFLNEEAVSVDPTQSEAEIASALEPIRDQLFEIFGCSFENVKVQKIYNPSRPAEAYAARITYYNEMNIWSQGDHIEIEFPLLSDRTLYARSISYYEHRANIDSYYYTEAKCELLTLEQAEALLKKGYVFSGHSCHLCNVSENVLSFDEYDYVGFEYRYFVNSDDPRGIPFYTFYKETKNAQGVAIYAKASVCAVEVLGQDEYFQSMEEWHWQTFEFDLGNAQLRKIVVKYFDNNTGKGEVLNELLDETDIKAVTDHIGAVKYEGKAYERPRSYYTIEIHITYHGLDSTIEFYFTENKLTPYSKNGAYYYITDETFTELCEILKIEGVE